MKEVTLITGNLNKVKYAEQHLGFPLKHVKIDLDEIQSLDLHEIVGHKVRRAYEKVLAPVLVEDVSLEFSALGHLPGPFIRFFMKEMSLEALCRLLDGKSRKATARVVYGYYDGRNEYMFDGSLTGEIAQEPKGEKGWDWDKIFIPEGSTKTRAEMTDEEYEKTILQLRPFAAVKEFLSNL